MTGSITKCVGVAERPLCGLGGAVKAPTLVIAGKHDPATPPEANEYIKNHIPGARLALLDAAHISNVEQAEAYTNAVLEFLLDRSR